MYLYFQITSERLEGLLLNFFWSTTFSVSSSSWIGSSPHFWQTPSFISSDDVKKSFPHLTQYSWGSSSWVFKCALKLHANANFFEQMLHWKGLSPVKDRKNHEYSNHQLSKNLQVYHLSFKKVVSEVNKYN